jgi:acyl-coenzyme A synthetase/AMP-(fatty) acid ligase
VSSLGFELVDRHVVEGRGDDIACADDTGTLTFAQLLERSAALAGGLRVLGVRTGDEVAVLVDRGNLQVIIICACVRIGALPGSHGEVRIEDDGESVRVRLHDHDLELKVLMRAGAADPAESLATDPPGLVVAVRDAFEDIVESLLAGTPVT